MLDRAPFWLVQPRQLSGDGITVTLLDPVPQLRISGDLAAACAALDLPPPVGLMAPADGPRAAIRLARNRMLAVGVTLPHADSGLRDGYALTPATGSLAVLHLDGPGAGELLARGTAVDLTQASPSAALLFAGMNAVLYRHGTGMRLHLDRGLVDYAFDWIEASGALRA
ncbi:hypothetical protein [Pararhodobacter sp. CCB-MM2]|uniref:hypothetical protein n=1 Tax=Pararhodobacter sp. CCB-MM2 TaxID=1786003 RepID=UPI000830DD2B|nr:hypothetical protein [Pararhodobacter sp. CCB-MM2]